MSKTIFKSIAALVAGFITVAVLSVATDTILEKTGIFTPPSEGLHITWMVVVAILYRTLYTVLGGYITAKLAPSNPMRHAVILGAVGTLFAILGASQGGDLAPAWFFMALIITPLPATWLGAKLAKK